MLSGLSCSLLKVKVGLPLAENTSAETCCNFLLRFDLVLSIITKDKIKKKKNLLPWPVCASKQPITCEEVEGCSLLAMSLLCQIVGLALIIPRPGRLSLPLLATQKCSILFSDRA